MATIEQEIRALENGLVKAELGPDPKFFEEVLADDVVLLGSGPGEVFGKAKVVEAHRPGSGPKFTRVEMSELKIQDHGTAVVVTCKGYYEGLQWTGTLRFLRVWLKKNGRWQVIAGSVSNA